MDQAQASIDPIALRVNIMEAQIKSIGQPTHLALDENLAAEITSAVCSAMRETFSIEVVPGPYEIGDGMVSLVGDVSGVIGMAQAHLEATLTLCLTFETVRDI